MEMTAVSELPAVRDHTLITREGNEITVSARLLGHDSSRRADNQHTHRGDFAPAGYRCGRCRWYEVSLFALDLEPDEVGDRYIVYTVGKSAVPDEVDRPRVAYAESANKVMELLVLQQDGRRPKLPESAAIVLDEAASYDAEIGKAYARWAAAGIW